MRWEDKVFAWAVDEVTSAFMAEVEEDIAELTNQLISCIDTNEMLRLQGMCRALKGVLGMVGDGIQPKHEEIEDA